MRTRWWWLGLGLVLAACDKEPDGDDTGDTDTGDTDTGDTDTGDTDTGADTSDSGDTSDTAPPDTDPPETTISAGPTGLVAVRNPTFEFACDEAACTFACQLDDAAFTACTSPHASAVPDGAHTFRVVATDAAGNVDATPAERAFSVDAPPTVTFTATPPAADPSPYANFEFACDEPCTALECATDAAPATFAACESPWAPEPFAEGVRTVYVRGTDASSQVGAAASYTWEVDLTAPTVTITGAPPAEAAISDLTLHFSCDDPPCTYDCTVTGPQGVLIEFGPCETPLVLGPLYTGDYSVYAWAYDAAGNQGTDAWIAFENDSPLPWTEIVSAPGSPTSHPHAEVNFECDKGDDWTACTYACSLDGAPFAPCAETECGLGYQFCAWDVGEGPHTFEVLATFDGRTQPEPTRWEWEVDLTPPTLVVTPDPADPASGSTVTFEFACEGEDCSFWCAFDSMRVDTSCTSPQTFSRLSGGDHRFSVIAYDAAQNRAGPEFTDWTTPTPTRSWVEVSAGGSHTCAVGGGGRLSCWGENHEGQVRPPATTFPFAAPVGTAGGTTWRAVDAGDTHTCAIDDADADGAGTLWCWGEDGSDQIGDSGRSSGDALVQVGTAADWIDVAAGGWITCGIREIGPTERRLYCWGNYAGSGSSTRIGTTPVEMGGGFTDWEDVDAGEAHACAIRDDSGQRTLYCWGQQQYGRLGNGTNASAVVTTPTAVTGGLTGWQSLGLGARHSCGVVGAGGFGKVYCFGLSSDGQAGTVTASVTAPAQIGTATDWIDVGGGWGHSCGLRDQGTPTTAWCWGDNSGGQLGDGGFVDSASPVAVSTPVTAWTALSVGQSQTCARRGNGDVACWGNGPVGAGFQWEMGVPTPVAEPGPWAMASPSTDHACAVHDDGTMWCWGEGFVDQRDQDAPVQVGADTDWVWVAAGSDRHACGLREPVTGQRSAWCWGYGGKQALGNGSGTSRTTPYEVAGSHDDWRTLAVGTDYSCGIREPTTGERRLWCWGQASQGRLGNGSASGEATTPVEVSLDADADGLADATPHATDWAFVSAGGDDNGYVSATFGIRDADGDGRGSLWAWGPGTSLLGLGEGTGDVTLARRVGADADWVSVDGDTGHACGLREDDTGNRTIWCWGVPEAALGFDGAEHWTPVEIAGDVGGWDEIVVTTSTLCARDGDALFCGGTDAWAGALGVGWGVPNTVEFPTAVDPLRTWASLAARRGTSCAIDTAGDLYCFGRDDDGQLGVDGLYFTEPVWIP